jgi:Protein of unknown function (DUF3040)
MAMTEDERRQLAAIEWDLTHDQPKLAKRLARLSRKRPVRIRSVAFILLTVTIEVVAVVTMGLARPIVGLGAAMVVAAMPMLWLAVAQRRGFSLWKTSASWVRQWGHTRRTPFR